MFLSRNNSNSHERQLPRLPPLASLQQRDIHSKGIPALRLTCIVRVRYGIVQCHRLQKEFKVILDDEYRIDWQSTYLSFGYNHDSIFTGLCKRRKGRWRREEEMYACYLHHQLLKSLPTRQIARITLAKILHSDEMRVLKKLNNCNDFNHANLSTSVSIESLRDAFLRSTQLEAFFAIRLHLDSFELLY